MAPPPKERFGEFFLRTGRSTSAWGEHFVEAGCTHLKATMHPFRGNGVSGLSNKFSRDDSALADLAAQQDAAAMYMSTRGTR